MIREDSDLIIWEAQDMVDLETCGIRGWLSCDGLMPASSGSRM